MTLPFCSLYHGTKFAVEGMSEAAALELAPLGVKVKLVEPGSVKTEFSGRSLVMTSSQEVTDYNEMMAGALERFGANAGGGSEPDAIAKVLFEAACDGSDRLRYVAGADAVEMLKTRARMTDEEHMTKIMADYKLRNEV
jgi:NAD(P)-dependent dehydrogenase (short-subunit alcohol dehydrogenase family)